MVFNIQEFSSIVGHKGLARVPHFMVNITSPAGLPTPSNDLKFRIDSINMPGRQINAFEFKPYGPAFKIGYGEQHGEVSINIMLSPDLAEKKYFLRWQDIIVGYGRGSNNLGMGTFDIGYYDDYKAIIDIFQYDQTGQQRYACKIIDAWPVSISDLPSDWSVDMYHRLGVTFHYRLFQDETSGYYDSVLTEMANESYQDGVAYNGNPNPINSGPGGLMETPSATEGQTSLQQDTTLTG